MSDARAAGRGPQGRVGTFVNGKWKIEARLGSGGMATVYAATHRNGHRAALKMLHMQLSRDASTRSRFLREGYVANAVGHPGVVAVEDDGVAEDGSAFLVLELLEGETIEARRLKRGGALPIDEALEIADQALDALAAAHSKGIVHRDVKPENVFLTNAGRVKLLDFGLARMKDMTQAETTKTGVTIGTPEFMPPEQAMGRRDAVDARSDVWGLGATLFTAITGKYVHDAHSLHEQLIASATRRAPAIRTLAPHVPENVAVVLDRALELEMQDRWPSAREMQIALRAARVDPHNEFTADSLTVPVSVPSPSKPISSDKTVAMTGAPSREAPIISGLPISSGPMGDDTMLADPPMTKPPHSPVPVTRRMSGSPAQLAQIEAYRNEPPTITPEGGVRFIGSGNAPSPRAFPASAPSPGPVFMGSQYPSVSAAQQSTQPYLQPPPQQPQPMQPQPMQMTHDNTGSTYAREKPGSFKTLIFVSIILIVVCASFGAYVLWRGSLPAMPQQSQPVPAPSK